VPPHKRDRLVTRAETRLEMLRAATAGNEQFRIDTSEIERTGPSYTVDTLRQLNKDPGDTVFLLIGVDQVREFSTWREPEEILRLARVVMLTRAGDDAPGADFVDQTVAVTRLDISSTLVRRRVGAGETIRYLVPDAVAQIIERERLYQ
jgi:nicotinate-nucleotide adenylyltransferase